VSLIRPFRDSANAWNCIHRASCDVQKSIISFAKGTMEDRIKLTDDVRKMRRELQAAVVEGGRDQFDKKLDTWMKHELMPSFIKSLNRHLSTIPAPRRRK